MAPLARVDAILLGCGNRGRSVYGAWARSHPERLRIVAAADPVAERRAVVGAEHGLGRAELFDDWQALLERAPDARVAIVATGDSLHVAPALRALELGYDVLLEKPIAPEPGDCVRVVRAAERAGRLLQIGHVLRYTPFYRRVYEIVRSGDLGELVHLDLREHVAYWHMTHSFVRGKFRSRSDSAPILLAKACHDLDLLAWLVDAPAERVASFGSLRHYRAEQAPEGAPARCLDGCPVAEQCPHEAGRFYLDADEKIARFWPWSDLSLDGSREARRRALETGPYGRCVYRCDNDVLDHQIVAVSFGGGPTASFGVHGHGSEERRTLRITGTRGELRGVLQTGELELTRHGTLGSRHERLEASPIGHFGGDEGLLGDFTEVAGGERTGALLASGQASLESHLIGFAAERSRCSGAVVHMDAYRAEVERAAS